MRLRAARERGTAAGLFTNRLREIRFAVRSSGRVERIINEVNQGGFFELANFFDQ
jgi:hypothetical protein